jgi:hypothetical protein
VAAEPKTLQRIEKLLRLAAPGSGTSEAERTSAALEAARLFASTDAMVVDKPPPPPRQPRPRPRPHTPDGYRPHASNGYYDGTWDAPPPPPPKYKAPEPPKPTAVTKNARVPRAARPVEVETGRTPEGYTYTRPKWQRSTAAEDAICWECKKPIEKGDPVWRKLNELNRPEYIHRDGECGW